MLPNLLALVCGIFICGYPLAVSIAYVFTRERRPCR